MGKGSAPSAPDPQQLAQAQMQINQQQAIQNAELNNVNQVGPTGSMTYTQTGTNADGTPIYTQTTALSPQLQALYNTGLTHAAGIQGAQGALINRIMGGSSGANVGGIGSQASAAQSMAAQHSPQALAQALSPMSTQATQLPAFGAATQQVAAPVMQATKPAVAQQQPTAKTDPWAWFDNSGGGGM